MSFLSEAGSYLLRSLPEHTLQDDAGAVEGTQHDVTFDSRFEGGNLMYAFERTGQESEAGVQEYELVLQNDVNSKGYGNWFYFKVHSRKPKTLRLHIVNAQKNFSFFSAGMRPAVFSLKKHGSKGVQWHYDGY